jgi:hypothetical protein
MLLAALSEQLGYIRGSAAAFDAGAEGEAKRLAVSIRVLCHDSHQSRALLTQLDVIERLEFLDSSTGIDPQNMAPILGLFGMQLGPRGGRFIPFLGDRPIDHPPLPFERWWHADVIRLSDRTTTYSRRQLVLTAANKEGGAHVDAGIDPLYHALAHENALGMVWGRGNSPPQPFNDPTMVAVRQIAYELLVTLVGQLPRILGREWPPAVGVPDALPGD